MIKKGFDTAFRCTFYAFVFNALFGCSIYVTRMFNAPQTHASPEFKVPEKVFPAYRINRFYAKPLLNTFCDTLDHTVISIKINNEYEKGAFGPPFIPLIPYKSGYGYSEKKLNKPNSIALANITIELTIYNPLGDSIYFTPSNFFLVSSQNNRKSIFKAIEGISVDKYCAGDTRSRTWRIIFKPGQRIEEMPIVFLNSLTVNGKNFHSEGIRFKIGRKSFYAPLSPSNG